MKEIWCDLCGIKLGCQIKTGYDFYGSEPNWQFFQSKQNMDVCNECEQKIRDAVHDTIEEIKKGKKKK